MSNVPDSFMWAGNDAVLTRDEAIRMDALRLAVAVMFEKGLPPSSLANLAKQFNNYIRTGEI